MHLQGSRQCEARRYRTVLCSGQCARARTPEGAGFKAERPRPRLDGQRILDRRWRAGAHGILGWPRAVPRSKARARGGLHASDTEPESVDWINDSTRPLIHAIPPRQAAEVALRIARETDELVASLSPELVAKIDDNSPLNPVRAHHRGEHLDEIEAALAGKDATRRPT